MKSICCAAACVFILQDRTKDWLQYAFSTAAMVLSSHKLCALKFVFFIANETGVAEVTGKPLEYFPGKSLNFSLFTHFPLLFPS